MFAMASFTDFDPGSRPSLADAPEPAPASPSPEKPKSARYQSLDLWRGLACVMLVLYHTTFYVPSNLNVWKASTWTVSDAAVKAANLMWIGVPIFFVVSGYCIAASVHSLSRGSYSLRVYFGRRVWRIYPPLWFACVWAVGFTIAISMLSPNLFAECRQLPRWEEWSLWNWIGNLTATESWQYHVNGGDTHYLMSNTWTLCYEEQFYAVVGVFLVIATRRFFLATLLVCGLTLACRHGARQAGWDQAGSFLDGHWLLFAAGIFLYYQLTHAKRAGWWAVFCLFVAGIGYAIVDRTLATNGKDKHFDEYLFVSCAFALALLALRRWDEAFMKAWILVPLQWLGKRSYSIYLTHFPVVVTLSCLLAYVGATSPTQWLFITLPSCVALSLALGWAFHLLVERHFLNAPVATPTKHA